MKLLYIYVACIFRMHQKNLNKDVPYISTLRSIWLVCLFFVVDCGVILRKTWGIDIIPNFPNMSKGVQYMVGVPILLLTFWLMSFFIHRKDIEDTAATLTKRTCQIGKYCHFCIILVELCILFVFVQK